MITISNNSNPEMPARKVICVTRSISIQAPPDAVQSFLGDARMLPSWAPGFARRVLPDGDQWIVEAGDGTRTRVALRACRDHGTVDVLVTRAPPLGAYMRVLGNGAGSELVLTVMVPDHGDAGAIARQQRVADDELQAVRGWFSRGDVETTGPAPTFS